MMRKPTYLLIIIALVGILCQTACHDGGNTVSDSNGEDSVFHVAVIPTLDCLPVYYARQCGLFDSLGLHIQLHTYQSPLDVDTSLQRHTVELAYSDLCRAIVLQQSDSIDIRVVARLHGRLCLMSDTANVRGASQLPDLNGRLVAIARYGITDYWSYRVTEAAGLDDAEIFRPNVGDVRLRTDMLCNHTIEHALLPEPYATEARLRGCMCLMEIDSVAPFLSAFVALTPVTKDSVQKSRLALFFQAYDMAVEQINESLTAHSGSASDSLAQLLHNDYLVGDTLTGRVLQLLSQLQPISQHQSSDAETALLWLRHRDMERAEYRIIKPNYTLNHLFWKNGL
ncbi:MAG: ABC transporter substrate-binding protein [Bacteroidaceae bacterium]|nr:ABC transporter substrate-binding protein [Bacteroidaceae bacterium]